MVLTVTLNPAVDKTYTAGELITGHVNRMRTAMSFAGGKGINVTRVLRQYDVPVCATGFLGGYTGDFIETSLKKEAVQCRFIRVDGETRSNTNILADNGYVTEILEPGPKITEEKLQQFLSEYETLLLDCELVILSGSPALGVSEDIYKTLIEKARNRGIRTFLDTSGDSLKNGIEAHPYLVKPNQKELEYVAGHKLVNRDAVVEAAYRIHTGGVAHVVVSMGRNGLISISGGQVYFAKTEKIRSVNTVGCGDSVVASYVMSILKRESKEETLRRAAAVGAANATTIKSAQIPLDVVEELYDSTTVERLR